MFEKSPRIRWSTGLTILCLAAALPVAAERASSEKAMEAQQQVDAAEQIVKQMKQDPKLQDSLQRAKGVFIIPKFGQGAAVVGARGGEGVLLVRREGQWTGPAFFDFGRLSVGAQAGGTGGSVAMLLMSDQAVNAFSENRNNFTVDANAGLTIADWEEKALASQARDVIVWSDVKGLFAGAAIGVAGVRRDAEDNRAYYMQATTPEQIFAGSVQNPHAEQLREALPARVAMK